jgi:hypothetical protein
MVALYRRQTSATNSAYKPNSEQCHMTVVQNTVCLPDATQVTGLGEEQTTVKPGYNDIGLCDISSIASDILWYELIHHC